MSATTWILLLLLSTLIGAGSCFDQDQSRADVRPMICQDRDGNSRVCADQDQDTSELVSSSNEQTPPVSAARFNKPQECVETTEPVNETDSSQFTELCEPTNKRLKPKILTSDGLSTDLASVALGSTFRLICKLSTVKSESNLAWTRCTSGPACSNQSVPDEGDFANKERIRSSLDTLGQLELSIDDFRREDTGDYYCRASQDLTDELNQSETKIRLVLFETEATDYTDELPYSRDTLTKLLPSLQVLPEFVEAQLGQQVQLICTTSYQDSDPDPSQLSWTFASLIGGREKLLQGAPMFQSNLSGNVSNLGNALVIWSVSEQHVGLYKCILSLADFNLTAEALAEVSLKPDDLEDSPPRVYVSPSLLRLSLNGSARIQCEATGYPPPDLIWYHENDLSSQKSDESLAEEGIEVQKVRYQDIMVYCHENRCATSDTTQAGLSRITSISLLTISGARGSHQGVFVCRAMNKYGSNQVSTVIDVELREPPLVLVDGKSSIAEQQVTLLEGNEQPTNVSFRCSIEAGRPQPHLRWLRKVNNNSIITDGSLEGMNLDEYDLNKVSSATSNVTIMSEQEGLALTLTMQISSLDDRGDYVCLGQNEWGKHSAVGRLTVRQPVSVSIAQASPFVGRLNQSFHLECIVSGYPPAVDIEWSKGSDQDPLFALMGIPGRGRKESRERIAVLKFDRVETSDAGEYTCSARDPLNRTSVVRDTIMLIVDQSQNLKSTATSKTRTPQPVADNSPELMVSPTKVDAQAGSNVTIDCLAIAGPQPTQILWVGPEPGKGASVARPSMGIEGPVSQFGTKLRISNMSKSYEGVYQCMGSNRFGIKNALALVNLLEEPTSGQAVGLKSDLDDLSSTKTKMAKAGSNIELKCQVSGAEQLATSWSRDGRELPPGSVQLGHNLWIQNVSAQDDGLYICLARSARPNKVIQAKINLLVQGETADSGVSGKPSQHLSARIVPSRASANVGDSITLECIVSNSRDANKRKLYLSDIENGVVWTNSHSGQTLFQDNVYIQGNLLIIYNLRRENSATYRCNYNDLSQHVEYKLFLGDSDVSPYMQTQANYQLNRTNALGSRPSIGADVLVSSLGKRAVLKQIAFGSQFSLECPTRDTDQVIWKRSIKSTELEDPVIFQSIKSSDADLYQCFQKAEANHSLGQPITSVIVQVLRPAARFVQRPVSFVTLPSVSGAENHLELELKFLADNEDGLILFNGLTHSNNRTGSRDYISLGLVQGYVEFKFELGDGGSSLKSLYPLSLQQWHRLAIERNRRGATMWVDKQPPVSNSSPGKFFNLDLSETTALYVGGHELFLQASKSPDKLIRLQGYSGGFQGCIGHLKINSNELQLMALNRSVALGVYECEEPECRSTDCNLPDGVCQVDWSSASNFSRSGSPHSRLEAPEMRCICMPGSSGNKCDIRLTTSKQAGSAGNDLTQAHQISSLDLASSNDSMALQGEPQGACVLLDSPCSTDGSLNCQSLTSTSYKCHCRIGFTGDTCAKQVNFASETSLLFNQYSYVHLRLNKPEESSSDPMITNDEANTLAKIQSLGEHQEITFKLKTVSSHGLIFYTGHAPNQSSNLHNDTLAGSNPISPRASKSMFVNLLSRLSPTVFDYLAIALIDGHLELSYELGSGVAIIRSSERVNDGLEHRIHVKRLGRQGSIQIDNRQRYEGSSPGKFTVLNIAAPEVYLAGLPHLTEPTNSNVYIPGFVGCLGSLEINTLGPLNLIRSDHLSQLRSARNIGPSCTVSAWPSTSGAPTSTTAPHKGHASSSAAPELDDPDDM